MTNLFIFSKINAYFKTPYQNKKGSQIKLTKFQSSIREK